MTQVQSPAKIRTTPATMRAAVLAEPGRFAVEDVPLPEPGPGQVRVRLEGCGVCASNIPPWEGREWFDYPMAPGSLGHEGWGVIDALGDDVKDLAPGDRVAMLSEHAYAQYDVAPAEMVVKLPASLGADPLPGEPLGCAMNIFCRSAVHRGHTVAIVGIGFLGAVLTRLCKNVGARVIAVSRRPHSLSVAQQMGADEIVEMDDHWKVIEKVAELTNGQSGMDVKGFCDRVIECTGKQWPLQLASELCAVRGRLVIAGFHQDGMREINLQLWNWRGLDVINAHEREPKLYIDGIRSAVDAIDKGDLDVGPLLTHTFPLDRLGEALQMTADRPAGFVKAMVLMHEDAMEHAS